MPEMYYIGNSIICGIPIHWNSNTCETSEIPIHHKFLCHSRNISGYNTSKFHSSCSVLQGHIHWNFQYIRNFNKCYQKCGTRITWHCTNINALAY